MNPSFFKITETSRYIDRSDPLWKAATKREKSFWTGFLLTPPAFRTRQQKKHALSYNNRRGTYALSAWRLT